MALIYPNLKYYPPFFHYDHDRILAETSDRRKQRADRDLVRAKREIIQYADIDSSLPLPPAFRFEHCDLIFDCLFAPKTGAQKLYVVLSGSKLEDAPWPVFKRNSWHPAFDGSVLYISDPLFSRFPSLSLGWYLGTPELDLYPILATIVEAVARKCNASEIIAYGSSGGGFAALKLGEWLPLRAIALNPQIFLPAYDYFPIFCQKTGFKAAPDWQSRSRVTVHEQSIYFLIQNDTDSHHCQAHVWPLLREAGIFPKYGLTGQNNIYCWQYHAIGGHNAQEDLNILPLILHLASRLPVYDDRALDTLDNMAIAISELWATMVWKNRQVGEAKNKSAAH